MDGKIANTETEKDLASVCSELFGASQALKKTEDNSKADFLEDKRPSFLTCPQESNCSQSPLGQKFNSFSLDGEMANAETEKDLASACGELFGASLAFNLKKKMEDDAKADFLEDTKDILLW